MNGVMKWSDIDEEYCISDVFVGNFKPHIFDDKKNKMTEGKDTENKL